MNEDFYSKKSVFGVPTALLLLMLVFFFVPFALRGTRMALQKTENNVKDWLPDDFRETEELAWFAKRFVSEQFIVATWEGCQQDDQRLKLFLSKLRSEQAPGVDADTDSEYFRARNVGAEYALFAGNDYYFNWGGKNEKWLHDGDGRQFYITPNGRLFRWEGNSNMVGAGWRAFLRATGGFQLDGQFIAAFGNPGTDGAPNPFWQDPRLLTAPLFKTIETGPDLVQQLAGPDGALANTTEPKAGERDAIARLTGTMFGPPVPMGFDWSSQALAEYLSEEKLAELPEDWQSIWDLVVQRQVEENYSGDMELFRASDPVDQSAVWYQFFDAVAVDEPQRQTCVVITLTEAARSNLGKVVGRGLFGETPGRLFQLCSECGISPPPVPSMAPPPFSLLASAPVVPEPAIRIGGPPVDNVAIDEEGTITLVRLIGYSLVLGLVLSWILLRSMRLMMMVFFVGGVSAMASLSMVWWSNASVDAVLLTMPSLVYVLGMAGAIHIINYYREATLSKGQKGAAERAINHALMPCTLAALTTAIGLLSLCSSNILPIRKFGIFSAMGVMATLVLLYTYLPSALTVFPPPSKVVKGAGQKAAAGILSFWETIGSFVLRRHWLVNSLCVIAFIALGIGLTRIQTSVQLLKLFDDNAQIIKDYSWLEENFGRLVPMELVVRFPNSLQQPLEAKELESIEDQNNARLQLSLLERAEAVARIQEVLQSQFGYGGQNIVGRGMSPVTLVPEIQKAWAGFNPVRSGYNRTLAKNFDQLLETDYLAIEQQEPAEGTELWRISLRLGALNDVDYGQFVAQLRSAVEPVVAAYRVRQRTIEAVLANSQNGDERPVGGALILGYSLERQDKTDSTGQTEDGIDRKKIFAGTVARCLVNQTLKEPVWHDPELHPLSSEKATSDEWARYLQTYSCLVVLEDHPDYDWDFIKQANPNIIDARMMLTNAAIQPASDRLPDDRPVEMSTREGEMDVVYTGVVPVVYKAQRTLLVSLIESVAWAFVLIAIVMSCLLSPARSFLSGLRPSNLLRGIASGMVSMIPNVFPVVIIFGFIGWSDLILGKKILVDIGTMMTASVAMGVAVDDTIHFLTWFRDGLRRGLDRREAIFVAYKHVAPAMTQTTVIAGLGLSVFALSTFTPTQMFGTLMLALLGAALIGDLIFLPALLASPLGRIFTMRPFGESGEQVAEDSEEDPDATSKSSIESPQLVRETAESSGAEPQTELPKLKIRRPQMLDDSAVDSAARRRRS